MFDRDQVMVVLRGGDFDGFALGDGPQLANYPPRIKLYADPVPGKKFPHRVLVYAKSNAIERCLDIPESEFRGGFFYDFSGYEQPCLTA
jgi:hypothetical protein